MSGTVDLTGLNPDTGQQELIKTDGEQRLLVSFEGGGGQPTTVVGPLGRRSDATSVSVALSTEDVAVLNGMAVAQGSATAAQVGSLVQGAVTTANPTYTTAQTSPLSLDPAGNLRVAETSSVSSTNSSAAPLGISGVFTGTSVSTLGYGSIVVSVTSNQSSATDGLSIQQSQDGTNWDIADVYTLTTPTGANFCIPVKASFARVVYTNGGSAQATFRLQTVLKPQMPVASAFRPADGVSIQNDFPGGLSIQQIYNGTTTDLAREVANGTNSVGTGIAAVGLLAQFDDATVTAITENSFGNLRMSADHVLYTSQAPTTSVGTAIVPSSTTVAASSIILKASAGNLYGINAVSGGSAGYVMLFNATSAPIDGTVTPLKCYVLAANSSLELEYTPPIRCGTGMTLVFSTTGPFTKTASATAFMSGDFL